MKKLLLLLFISSLGNAQTTEKRDSQFQIDYEMELAKHGSSIVISTYDSPTQRDKSLILRTTSHDCAGLKGVRIRLLNGDNLIFDNIAIECGPFAPNRGNASATILLTDALQAQLEGQEIYEFTLGNISVPVKFKEPNENFTALQKWAKDERGF